MSHQTRHPKRPEWREQDEPECKACRDTGMCPTCHGDGCEDCDYFGTCKKCNQPNEPKED